MLNLFLAVLLGASIIADVTALHFHFTNTEKSLICDKNVELTVFYDSGCNGSESFIINQILPLANHKFNWLRISLVPYGLADRSPDGLAVCMYGPDECFLNRVQICAFERIPDKTTKGDHERIAVAECVLSRIAVTPFPEIIGEKCITKAGLKWNEIRDCANGQEGRKLEKQYLAKALKADLSYVPIVAFNGSFGTEAFQNMTIYDIMAMADNVHCGEITVPTTLPPPVRPTTSTKKEKHSGAPSCDCGQSEMSRRCCELLAEGWTLEETCTKRLIPPSDGRSRVHGSQRSN